jgi:hypothetical protein
LNKIHNNFVAYYIYIPSSTKNICLDFYLKGGKMECQWKA